MRSQQPPHLTMREAATLRCYVRWRANEPRWRAAPYLPATDDERRRACGAAIARSLAALGGLGAVW